MLVLTRRIGERVRIGEDVWITIVAVEGRRVRLGLAAPPDVEIRREELVRVDDQEEAG